MKEEVLSIIEYIQAEKKKRSMVPDHAMYIQILSVARKRIDATLIELVNEGSINEIRCINEKAYCKNQDK